MFKLSKDHTAVNRRDVLKGIVGAVGSTVLPTGAIEEVAKAVPAATSIFTDFQLARVAETIIAHLFPIADDFGRESLRSVDEVLNYVEQYLPIDEEMECQIKRLVTRYAPQFAPVHAKDFQEHFQQLMDGLSKIQAMQEQPSPEEWAKFMARPEDQHYVILENTNDPTVLRLRQQAEKLMYEYEKQLAEYRDEQKELSKSEEFEEYKPKQKSLPEPKRKTDKEDASEEIEEPEVEQNSLPESTEDDEFRESALASSSTFPRNRSEWQS